MPIIVRPNRSWALANSRISSANSSRPRRDCTVRDSLTHDRCACYRFLALQTPECDSWDAVLGNERLSEGCGAPTIPVLIAGPPDSHGGLVAPCGGMRRDLGLVCVRAPRRRVLFLPLRSGIAKALPAGFVKAVSRALSPPSIPNCGLRRRRRPPRMREASTHIPTEP